MAMALYDGYTTDNGYSMWVAPLLVLPVHASSGDKVVRTKEDVKVLGAGRGQNSYSLCKSSAFISRIHACMSHA